MEHKHSMPEEPDLLAQHYMAEYPISSSETAYETPPEDEGIDDLGEAPDLDKVMNDIRIAREELKLEQVERELTAANAELEQLRRVGIVGKVEKVRALEEEDNRLREEMERCRADQEHVENWLKGNFQHPNSDFPNGSDIPIPEERQPESVRAALNYYSRRIGQIDRRIHEGIPAEMRLVGLTQADGEHYKTLIEKISSLQEQVESQRSQLDRERESTVRRSGSHASEPTIVDPEAMTEASAAYNL